MIPAGAGVRGAQPAPNMQQQQGMPFGMQLQQQQQQPGVHHAVMQYQPGQGPAGLLAAPSPNQGGGAAAAGGPPPPPPVVPTMAVLLQAAGTSVQVRGTCGDSDNPHLHQAWPCKKGMAWPSSTQQQEPPLATLESDLVLFVSLVLHHSLLCAPDASCSCVLGLLLVVLCSTCCHVQDLFLVLANLPRFLAACNASTLQPEDAALICEALLAALPDQGPLPQQVLASPGITIFYGVLEAIQGQLTAAQQLQVLECLAAMSKAGCGEWGASSKLWVDIRAVLFCCFKANQCISSAAVLLVCWCDPPRCTQA